MTKEGEEKDIIGTNVGMTTLKSNFMENKKV